MAMAAAARRRGTCYEVAPDRPPRVTPSPLPSFLKCSAVPTYTARLLLPFLLGALILILAATPGVAAPSLADAAAPPPCERRPELLRAVCRGAGGDGPSSACAPSFETAIGGGDDNGGDPFAGGLFWVACDDSAGRLQARWGGGGLASACLLSPVLAFL